MRKPPAKAAGKTPPTMHDAADGLPKPLAKIAAPDKKPAASLKPASKGAETTVLSISETTAEAADTSFSATSAPTLAPVTAPAPVAEPEAPWEDTMKVETITAEPSRSAPIDDADLDDDNAPAVPIAKMVFTGKEEAFLEGDYVVYPTHGVGKVEKIAVEDIAGHRLELIHITFEENRMTLRVPVAKARSAGLRKLATKKMFDEALGILKGRARIKRTMWSRRAQEYEAKINSGDPMAIAEVVRDLHRNAGQPDQSFSERQIYEAAMDRLAAELAAIDQTDKATASVKLAEFLKTIT
jgi:CarD family transcriptional regulator